jgi:hypothetical protein
MYILLFKSVAPKLFYKLLSSAILAGHNKSSFAIYYTQVALAIRQNFKINSAYTDS